MNERLDPSDGQPEPQSARPKHPATLVAAVILLFLECLLVLGAAGYLLVELLIDTPVSYASAIAILILTVLAAVWIGMTGLRMLAGQPWTRGSAVVWQVLQASIGVGSLQGQYASPVVGWALIAASVAVLVLLFSKPVVDATARPGE